MRSLLLVPGDSRPDLDQAIASGADALVIDLEASVAPEAKEAARRTTLGFLSAAGGERTRPRLLVRVNTFASGLAPADLAVVMAGAPDGVVLPGAVGSGDVQRLAAALAVREAEEGLPDGATRILAIAAGSAAGTLALGTLSRASPRLSGIAWCGDSLAADLGAATSRDPAGAYTEPCRLARSLALMAASAAGVDAVDAVTSSHDLDGFARETHEAARDGFAAKVAAHPAQVPVINEATPSPEAAARAPRRLGRWQARPGED